MPLSFPPVFCRLALPLLLATTSLMAPDPRAQAQGAAPIYAVPRAGAARVLRLIDANGKPLRGSFSEPQWETRGGGLFFTRDWGGTRNIWRAFPDPQDANRYPTWRALPITQFQKPLGAFGAVPVRGTRSLLLVSNATNPSRPAQIVLFDMANASLRPLTNFENGTFDAAASPNGKAFAFAVTRGGVTSIYSQSLDGGAARRVALNARRPAWQDNNTLLVESVVNATIFQLMLTDASRPAQIARGSQASASRDGSLLVLAASGNDTPDASRLYLLAGDGSGLRAITGTEGASNPALSGDGRGLAFDAPPSPGEADHALWVLPLEPDNNAVPVEDAPRRRVVDNPQLIENARLLDPTPVRTRPSAPIAQISGVAASSGGTLAILGAVSGEGASATLEIGAGNAPTRWTPLPVTLPRAMGQPLSSWTPPPGARGLWNLRLSVVNDAGAMQSTFSFRLPLNSSVATPILAPGELGLPPGGPLPRAPLPDLPAPPSLPRPAPLPRPLPRPLPTPTPYPAPLPRPNPLSPAPPRPTPRPAPRPAPLPTPRPLPRPTPRPVPQPTPTPLPSFPQQLPSQPQPPVGFPTPAPTPVSPSRGVGSDAGTFNISGTLAKMTVSQGAPVTFWALNNGTRTWDSGKTGPSTGAVRLVTRWIDFSSGGRRKWTLNWLKGPVVPGARTSFNFQINAPPQPGRYKLIYGLVRVPNENWQPPAYNAPQESWPGEFAAIAFAVTVK